MRTKSSEIMDKILQYIDSKYCESSTPPSVREIAENIGLSKSCVSNYIAEMKEKGMLDNNSSWRGVKTKMMDKMQQELTFIPVVGQVACGTPILAQENIETYLPMPKGILGNGKFFVLVAHGDSMINAGITNGDYVIVRQQEDAEQGQIVVALIDEDATLKRYYLDEDKRQVKLHPENDDMEDMYFDHIAIQGVAVKVIKDLV